MNYRVVIRVLGNLLVLESIMMLPPLLVAIINGGTDITAFIISIMITLAVGIITGRTRQSREKVQAREGLTIVVLGWILVSVFGALPFLISGAIPSIVDALFETISGFTTTGATILRDTQSLPRGLLFWRSFTQWIGGMGILVFTLMFLPTIGVGAFQIYKAEIPGPTSDKIAPKMRDTAIILYAIYLTLSVIQFILLLLGGMSVYDAIVHTFSTLGTGGFSPYNSADLYINSRFIQVVIAVFMVLASSNYVLFVSLYKGRLKDIVKNEEFRFYIKVILVSTLLIGFNLFYYNYGSFFITMEESFFHVVSMVSSSGFATTDYELWPSFSKLILFFLMFVGGSSGSTGSGVKVIRILILIKIIKREILKIYHPRAVIPLKVNGRSLSNDAVNSVTSFFMLYLFLFVIGALVVSLEGYDFIGSISMSAASIGNIGLTFGFSGPSTTYADFSVATKIVCSFLMLAGRLELFTLIALITPTSWKNES